MWLHRRQKPVPNKKRSHCSRPDRSTTFRCSKLFLENVTNSENEVRLLRFGATRCKRTDCRTARLQPTLHCPRRLPHYTYIGTPDGGEKFMCLCVRFQDPRLYCMTELTRMPVGCCLSVSGVLCQNIHVAVFAEPNTGPGFLHCYHF